MNTTQKPSGPTLLGRELRVIANEPWDFAGAWGGWRPAIVVALSANHDEVGAPELLLRLATPVEFDGTPRTYFVATPRYRNRTFQELSSGPVEGDLTWIPDQQADSPGRFDLSEWRGGLAAIATLKAMDE